MPDTLTRYALGVDPGSGRTGMTDAPDGPWLWRDDVLRYIDALTAARLPDPSLCDCNSEPIRGIKAGRHLPSCRYGIILDYLDVHDPRAEEPHDA